jgi:hypothetical protein
MEWKLFAQPVLAATGKPDLNGDSSARQGPLAETPSAAPSFPPLRHTRPETLHTKDKRRRASIAHTDACFYGGSMKRLSLVVLSALAVASDAFAVPLPIPIPQFRRERAPWHVSSARTTAQLRGPTSPSSAFRSARTGRSAGQLKEARGRYHVIQEQSLSAYVRHRHRRRRSHSKFRSRFRLGRRSRLPSRQR